MTERERELTRALREFVETFQRGLRPVKPDTPFLSGMVAEQGARMVKCLKRARLALGMKEDWRPDVLGEDWLERVERGDDLTCEDRG